MLTLFALIILDLGLVTRGMFTSPNSLCDLFHLFDY